MAKVERKTDENGTPASISLVAEMLRKKGNESTGEEAEQPITNEKIVPEKEKQTQNTSLIQGSELEKMLFNVKQHREQNNIRRPIMVDEELYDIFAMLKAKKRVPAASLVSMICRKWIIENKTELQTILGQTINVQ